MTSAGIVHPSATMHIACAADENYAPHCAAMLHSLLTSNSARDITVHFLFGPRLDPQVLDGLRHVVEGMGSRIDFIEIDDTLVSGLQKRGKVAGVMWYRVFLPERLPDLERILYLDADLLVLESLKPLWNIDFNGQYAAAVCNDFEPTLAHRPRELGLRAAADYFNSGVLLMNLAAMRSDGIPARVLQVARTHIGPLMWQDQDPLNIVLDGRWERLHPRWNCQNSLFFSGHAADLFSAAQVREACACPAIVHFEGPEQVKPWHYLSKHPYRERYLHHRAQTPWAAFTPTGRTLQNRLLRPLPVKAILLLSGFIYRARRKLQRMVARLHRSGAL